MSQPPGSPDNPDPESAWPPTQAPTGSCPDGPLATVAGEITPLAMPVAAASRPSVAAILGVIRRLRLLEGERLAEAERLAAENDPEALCRELLQRQWLTALQVNRLLSGEGDSLAVGGCVLLRRLGAGGMGMVFEARQTRMGRIVAIKLIHKDCLASEEAVRRFRREVAATSRLEHANVVRALDAGCEGGSHYLVLELVEGTDLARLVAQQGPLPPHEACELVRQAALGLQHAHEQGLVHRDVKPSNLILTTDADGKPVVKLLDLGLSRSESAETSSTSLTSTGAVMGTPDFMAPEQARDSKRSDVRSDLYSLGCTLYFLLTGRPPFSGGTLALKLVQHQMDEPEPVESLRPQVPAAVAAVVRKLMAKKPEDRYQTPGELADVIAGILRAANWSPAGAFGGMTGDATEVVNPPSLARQRRLPWSPRRLALAVTSAVAVVALFGVLWWLLTKPAEAPPAGPEIGPAPPDYVLHRLSRDRIPSHERLSGQPSELVQVLGEHRGRHWDAVSAVAFSANGKVVYSAGNQQLVAWDAATLRQMAWTPTTGKNVRAMGCVREGNALFVSDYYTGTSFYSLPELKRLPEEDPKRWMKVLCPEGRFGLTGIGGGTLRLLDLNSKREGKLLADGFGNELIGVAFSPDGKVFAHAENDGGIVLRQTNGGKEVGRLAGHKGGGWATSLAFSPNGTLLASGGGTKKEVRLWDVSSGKPLKDWDLGGWRITSLSFAAQDQIVALAHAGTRSSAFVLTDAKMRRPIGDPINESRGLQAMAVSPDGKLLALGDTERRVRLWKIDSGEQAVPTSDNQGHVMCLALSADGTRAITTGAGELGGQAILWDVESGRSLTRLEGKARTLRAVAIAADGKTFYAGTGTGEIALYALATGKHVRQWPSLGARINALEVLPDGRVAVALEATDGKVVLLDPDKGKATAELPGFDGRSIALAVGGKGEGFRLVACGHRTRDKVPIHQLTVYSSGGNLRDSLSGDRVEGVLTVAVSPDGTRLATGSYKGVLLWEVDRLEREPSVVTRTTNTVHAVAFFPDGKRLAIADRDGVVQIRTLEGKEENRWQMPGPVHALAVDRRGEYLVTGNGNGTVYVLRLAGPR